MTIRSLAVALVAALTLTAAPAMGADVPADDPQPVVTCGADAHSCVTPEPTCGADAHKCPTVYSAGKRPRDRHDVDVRRSCKSEAKVWKRYESVTWNLTTRNTLSGDVVESWVPQFNRQGWTRILPTPYGCKKSHQRWVQNHKGQVRGGRA